MNHAEHVLHAVYCLSRDTRFVTTTILAARVGTRTEDVTRVLAALDRAGLVDAERLRLTLRGYAAATILDQRFGSPPYGFYMPVPERACA